MSQKAAMSRKLQHITKLQTTALAAQEIMKNTNHL